MPLHWSNSGSAAEDMAACRELIRGGSRSFFNASLLLPRKVRDPAYALYAFCRLADDQIDMADAADRFHALDRLRNRLDRAYAGQPLDQPADRAFTRMIQHFQMPRALPEALLEGFQWDAEGRTYTDLSDVHAYGARVAGAVGAMMTVLMDVRDGPIIARATDLGVAMQLTNIARDVGEDAREGRLYLPRAWMLEAGIEPDAWLKAPVFSPALAIVIRRLMDAADDLYDRSRSGIGQLPMLARPGIQAARLIYSEIGHQVERNDLNSVDTRAVVSKRRKLQLLAKSLITSQAIVPGLYAPPLPENQFLVDAVTAAPPRQLSPHGPVDDRLGWLVQTFQRMSEHDRVLRSHGPSGPTQEG